jgi:hypothetical protein
VIPGAEGGEIISGRTAARAHQEGRLGIVGGNLSRLFFDGIRFADDELVSLIGIFPHGAGIVGSRNSLREDIIDDAILGGGQQSLMESRIPGILDRRCMNAGDFEFFGCERTWRNRGEASNRRCSCKKVSTRDLMRHGSVFSWIGRLMDRARDAWQSLLRPHAHGLLTFCQERGLLKCKA